MASPKDKTGVASGRGSQNDADKLSEASEQMKGSPAPGAGKGSNIVGQAVMCDETGEKAQRGMTSKDSSKFWKDLPGGMNPPKAGTGAVSPRPTKSYKG